MIVKPDLLLYVFMVSNERWINEKPNVEKHYKPYTTTHLMTNKDMYNIQKVFEEMLIKEMKQENKKIKY